MTNAGNLSGVSPTEGLPADANWRLIQGSDFHAVSDDGRVYSRLHAQGRVGPWRQLSFTEINSGYRFVRFSVNGKKCKDYVHRLVLIAFTGPPIGNQECCHGDGNPRNNTLPNLRWGSRLENAADRKRHGRVPRSGKQLTSTDKLKIVIAKFGRTQSLRSVAAEIGVTEACVHGYLNRIR